MAASPTNTNVELSAALAGVDAATLPLLMPPGSAPSEKSGPEPLQALLAFSALHEQVRQRRARQAGAAAARPAFPNGLEGEQFLLGEVLQLVAERALALAGADGIAIALAEGHEVICRASAGAIAPDLGMRLDLNSAFSGACFRAGKVVRCDDAESDARVNRQVCRLLGTRSMVAVPLRGPYGVVGLLEAFSSEAYGFDDSAVRGLSLLGELILAAMKPEEEEQLTQASQAALTEAQVPAEAGAPEIAGLVAPSHEPIAQSAQPEHPENHPPAFLNAYQNSEGTRPGLRVAALVVMAAILLAGGLWWRLRAKTQPSGLSQAVNAAVPAPQAANPGTANVGFADQNKVADATLALLPQVTGVRHWSSADSSTVAIDLQDQVQYEAHRLTDPERIYFDLHDTALAPGLNGKTIEVGEALLVRVRVAQPAPGITRVVLETAGASKFSVSLEENPYRLVVEVRGAQAQETPRARIDLFAPAAPSGRNRWLAPAASPSAEDIQLRAPKFRIVIDAGHGGWDLGTVGRGGLLEKDLALEIAQRLGRMLESRLGSEVIYTRRDDNYIPLEQRADLANQSQADLFVSIHANNSGSPSARGVETYYTNLFSPPVSQESEKRENGGAWKSGAPVALTHVELREKAQESRRFAASVQRALYSTLAEQNSGIRDRGVKEASFVVLKETVMPSILAEVSFVSSPSDERNLQSAVYRQQIAEALYKGIARYAAASHRVKMASTSGRPTGR